MKKEKPFIKYLILSILYLFIAFVICIIGANINFESVELSYLTFKTLALGLFKISPLLVLITLVIVVHKQM